MNEKLTDWQLIRDNWVNGNRTDARNMLNACTKLRLQKLVYEVLTEGREAELQILSDILHRIVEE